HGPLTSPNTVRTNPDPSCSTNCTLGTLEFRRTFTNNTGSNITKLRFRVIVDDTLNTPTQFVNQADLRFLDSTTIVVPITGGGSVTTEGMTIDSPPVQTLGGGLNATATVGSVTAGTPLAPGASISVRFRLGVMQSGNYRFYVNVESTP